MGIANLQPLTLDQWLRIHLMWSLILTVRSW